VGSTDFERKTTCKIGATWRKRAHRTALERAREIALTRPARSNPE
jgi:hypothetical protein